MELAKQLEHQLQRGRREKAKMGEILSKTRDIERVSQREQEGQMKAM